MMERLATRAAWLLLAVTALYFGGHAAVSVL